MLLTPIISKCSLEWLFSSKIFTKSNDGHFSEDERAFYAWALLATVSNHSLDAKICAESNDEILVRVRCTIAKILCVV